jgi:hypothetical protein
MISDYYNDWFGCYKSGVRQGDNISPALYLPISSLNLPKRTASKISPDIFQLTTSEIFLNCPEADQLPK